MTARASQSTANRHVNANVDVQASLAKAAASGLDALVFEAVSTYGSDLKIASSFGVEDMIVIDAVAAASARLQAKPQVFLLDTGRLHQETFDLVERVRDRYLLPITVFMPVAEDIQKWVDENGPNAFYGSVDARKACCNLRKVEPLSRALASARAWMTGLRREQSVTRAELSVVEEDSAHGGILKINPLFDWTEQEVWKRAKERKVPTHALHAQGYASIGCAPCTRAVKKGEHARAGRWWWEDTAQKECGLHPARKTAKVAR
jgi:phosphoadenosine phosphosulfate reductase